MSIMSYFLSCRVIPLKFSSTSTQFSPTCLAVLQTKNPYFIKMTINQICVIVQHWICLCHFSADHWEIHRVSYSLGNEKNCVKSSFGWKSHQSHEFTEGQTEIFCSCSLILFLTFLYSLRNVFFCDENSSHDRWKLWRLLEELTVEKKSELLGYPWVIVVQVYQVFYFDGLCFLFIIILMPTDSSRGGDVKKECGDRQFNHLQSHSQDQ